MTELVLSEANFTALRDRLLPGQLERCAVIYANQTLQSPGTIRLLGREIIFPADVDYASQAFDGAVLRPEFVARVTKKARLECYSLIFVHTHPGSLPPMFSSVDDEGEAHLAEFLRKRAPHVAHGAMVMSKGGIRARILGGEEEIRVISVGEVRKVQFDPKTPEFEFPEHFDRQIRAFGASGQRAIQQLCVGIVGLGGTGSIVAQQLAHLGVQRFVLLDPDVIETSNLNRVVGARRSDVSRPKVRVSARTIQAIEPAAKIDAIRGDVIHATFAKRLLASDFLFGCTDSHGSRAVLQQVSYQYLIPCIDLGTTITNSGGVVTGIFGRVQMLAPGLPCLTCSELLDSEEVRRDMMSAFERKLDPYIPGSFEPAPAVISINGVVASLAVTMFMAAVTELPSPARYLIYNGMKSNLRSVRSIAKNDCYICSMSGTLARGDSYQLYARQD